MQETQSRAYSQVSGTPIRLPSIFDELPDMAIPKRKSFNGQIGINSEPLNRPFISNHYQTYPTHSASCSAAFCSHSQPFHAQVIHPIPHAEQRYPLQTSQIQYRRDTPLHDTVSHRFYTPPNDYIRINTPLLPKSMFMERKMSSQSDTTKKPQKEPVKRYACQHCEKRFSRPSSLSAHMTVHTGEKPHVCPLPGCGRAFSVLSNQRRHIRSCQRKPHRRSGFFVLSNMPPTPQDSHADHDSERESDNSNHDSGYQMTDKSS